MVRVFAYQIYIIIYLILFVLIIAIQTVNEYLCTCVRNWRYYKNTNEIRNILFSDFLLQTYSDTWV